MKREEKQKLKAKEIQEKILNETYKENFSHGEADFIIQPDAGCGISTSALHYAL